MKEKSKILRHLKSVGIKNEKIQIKGVDFIYLINLDKRQDRLIRILNQFSRYGIFPHRFPAIYGWDLSQETFNDIGLKVLPSTSFDRPVHFSPVPGGAVPKLITLSCIGKTCVHHTMAAGALGVYLSHLSILMDAYQSQYRTIWVLEDDVTVKNDPHNLTESIDKLDELVGPDVWDILYTDNDDCFTSSNVLAHMGGGSWGRPGIPMTQALLENKRVGKDFIKNGGRCQAHSMIIRQNGIRKILDFIIPNGIFRPYDTELPYIPDITFYNSLNDIVHGRDRTFSDTFYRLS
ncbi:MAG: glycosyltransferase 25 family er-like [Parachlamydiales bacterium]|nr:glycosyltransferase 25 family er-like [Parachlamydiales bacterium]